MTVRPPNRRAALPLFFCSVLAFLLPLLLYLPALRFDLVTLDDPSFIATNPLVLGGLRLASVRDAFSVPVPSAPMYVPLLWISYMMDVSLFGNQPWSFHLSNILLHSGSSLLLFLLLLRLAGRFSSRAPSAVPFAALPASFLLALLWALHPLRVESVVWVAERKDCLAVFFCLLALHAWISALDDPSAPRRTLHAAAALLFFLLGLLSKPSLVPLPFFLALLCGVPPPAAAARPFPVRSSFPGGRLVRLGIVLLPFFLLSLLASAATSVLHAQHAAPPPPPLLSRLATIPSVLLFYLAKTAFPRNLSVLYPQWTSPLWLGALLSVPLLAAAVWLFRRRRVAPLPFLGAAFAALFLLPVSGIVPVAYNLVADRYALLPSIGLSLAMLPLFLPRGNPASPPLSPVSRRPALPRLLSCPGARATALLFCACAACAVATARHLPTWRDSDALFLPARRLLPDHFTIRAYDARLARRHGDFAAARECASRACAIYPDYYLFLADIPDAIALDGPQAAIDRLLDNPPPPPALSHWSVLAASIQLELGNPADALAVAARALPSSPPSDPFRDVLLQIAMIASWRLGDAPAALAFARQSGAVPPGASSLVPGHFIQYYVFLWNNDDRLPALRYFRELADSDPTPSVLNNIAWLLASSFYSPAPPSEAVGLARRALASLPPGSPLRPNLLDTLSVALANASDFPAAVDAVSEAISLLPPSSPALPALRSRLALYRQALPYREILGRPVPPSKYAFDPHL